LIQRKKELIQLNTALDKYIEENERVRREMQRYKDDYDE